VRKLSPHAFAKSIHETVKLITVSDINPQSTDYRISQFFPKTCLRYKGGGGEGAAREGLLSTVSAAAEKGSLP
jgi:hypothetical protein